MAITSEQREHIRAEALTRAVSGQSFGNWPVIIEGFVAKGIPESEILPRENVFTYNAWLALGRQVRKGEHGVKVVTFVACKGKEEKTEGETGQDGAGKGKSYRRPWMATVFHISQTDPAAK